MAFNPQPETDPELRHILRSQSVEKCINLYVAVDEILPVYRPDLEVPDDATLTRIYMRAQDLRLSTHALLQAGDHQEAMDDELAGWVLARIVAKYLGHRIPAMRD